jgi:hypothetical protein
MKCCICALQCYIYTYVSRPLIIIKDDPKAVDACKTSEIKVCQYATIRGYRVQRILDRKSPSTQLVLRAKSFE